MIKLKLTTVFGLDRYHYQAWPRTCSIEEEIEDRKK